MAVLTRVRTHVSTGGQEQLAPRSSTAIEIHIPVLPPSANRMWRVGHGRIYKSDAYVNWLNQAGHFVNRQCPGTILGRYKLTVVVARSRKDLDNHAKPANDLLQKMGVIEDDKLCEQITLRWHFQGEGMILRVERV